MIKSRKTNNKRSVIKHLHRRILVQIILFPVIAIILFGVIGVDVFQSKIGLALALLGIVIGLGVGIIIGRIFAMHWHPETEKVIMKMDKMGVILIVAYILFRSFSKQIFGEWIHGEALTIFTLCMLGGIMVGRVFGMGRSLAKILKEQQIV
jgi:hypothetical protein